MHPASRHGDERVCKGFTNDMEDEYIAGGFLGSESGPVPQGYILRVFTTGTLLAGRMKVLS